MAKQGNLKSIYKHEKHSQRFDEYTKLQEDTRFLLGN